MRKSSFVVVSAVLAAAGLTGPALAVYNTPSKAKAIKTDLVVAYSCSAPNATQFFSGTGLIPACSPPSPTTNTNPTHKVTFGPKGAANVQTSVATGDIKVGIKTADTLDNGVAANGINLGTKAGKVVATSGSCALGLPPQPMPTPGTECTSTDISGLFALLFSIPCTAGKCQLKTTVNTIAPGAVSAGGKANTEIDGISLTDPDGDLAFSSGLFIP